MMRKILIIILAIVLGEVALVLGTTLAQEVFFDGIGWNSSGKLELALGGLGSFLAAVAAGLVAYLTVKRSSDLPLIVLSLLVIAETTWIILSGRTGDSTWFDILASSTLIIGFWVAKWVLTRKSLSIE